MCSAGWLSAKAPLSSQATVIRSRRPLHLLTIKIIHGYGWIAPSLVATHSVGGVGVLDHDDAVEILRPVGERQLDRHDRRVRVDLGLLQPERDDLQVRELVGEFTECQALLAFVALRLV